MKGLTNILLIAGGGYLVAKYFGFDPLASLNLGSIFHTGIEPAPAPTQSTPQANNPNVAPDTKALIAKRMEDSGVDHTQLYNTDTFNWYYEAVRGIPGPAPETLFPNNPRDQKYSIDEWWAAMASHGMSGLYSYHGMGNLYSYHGMKGMGVVANMNPWVNHYVPGPGRTILPLGSETFIKFVN